MASNERGALAFISSPAADQASDGRVQPTSPMSVCIVAAYPWQCIASRKGLTTPGVVVASDTCVTVGHTVGPWLITKQSLIARNILVCYTSSHAEATSFAIRRSQGQRSLKAVGEAFRNAHTKFGGFTELIAVVWRGTGIPQVLELMPPRYAPRPRFGIVGIGDADVLSWFREHFQAELEPERDFADFDTMAEAWKRQFGTSLELPSPHLPIETAALHVGAALSNGIKLAGGVTVALPIQLMTVGAGHVQQLQMASSADLKNWDTPTTKLELTRFAPPSPNVIARHTEYRCAVQLIP